MKDVGEAFNPKTGEEKTKEKSERVVDEETVKALQAKIAKPLFEANVRIVASAGSQFQAAGYYGWRRRRFRPVRQSDAQRFQDREAAQPEKDH